MNYSKEMLGKVFTKIKVIYLPFIAISVITVLTYNILRWTFDIRLDVLPLKDDLLNYWFPIASPWIPILIWLRPRIRILEVRGKRDNGHFFYQCLMAVTIIIPLILCQSYMDKASFDLMKVNTPEQTVDFKNEKYFQIDSYEIDQYASLPYATARTSGSRNDNLNYYLFFACPFVNVENVWYGVQFKENLSNRISDERKESKFKTFLFASDKEFKSYDFQDVKYFEKLGYSDERDGFINAIKKKHSEIESSNQIILIPKRETFKDRLGSTFNYIFISFGIGALVIFLMVIIPKIDEKELANLDSNKPLRDDDLRNFLAILNPLGSSQGTAILLLLNIIVFILMLFLGINIISPTPQELLEIGGNRRSEVLGGEYWRLISSIFIHSGIKHLIMNLFGLCLGAVFLHNVLGKLRFVICFIVFGVLGSLASIYWNENTVSVGASGAIFGLYGVMLSFLLLKIYPSSMRKIVWGLLLVFGGVSLLLGFFGGVDNAAHIGGLISGFIYGIFLTLLFKERLKVELL